MKLCSVMTIVLITISDEHVLLKQKVTLLEATVAGQRDEISKLGHILDDKNSFVAAQSGELQQLKDMLETLTTSLELSGKQNEELRVEVQNKNAIIASCTTSATTSAKKKRVLKRPNLKIDDSGNPSTPLKSQSDVIPAAATNEEPKIHTCSKCNKQFLERKYLNRHIKSHDPSIACSTCGKRLAHNAALKQHQRSHDPSGEFQLKLLTFSNTALASEQENSTREADELAAKQSISKSPDPD
ncbi:unnamed protein product [Allacma fusca]|uniref:C2H2-type domain-containing protein n=1 Tax=Allacma fusca TaxID=39272 RepID=A0A8J2NPE1_9HEXA|nr:unnamed protein product [Allacma fusca]